jgi:hypothetical protein
MTATTPSKPSLERGRQSRSTDRDGLYGSDAIAVPFKGVRGL